MQRPDNYIMGLKQVESADPKCLHSNPALWRLRNVFSAPAVAFCMLLSLSFLPFIRLPTLLSDKTDTQDISSLHRAKF